jgi:uncharacterized membrane protein
MTLSSPSSGQNDALQAVSWVSYVLHLIVAISALVPGGQFGTVLLIAALVLDMVKREDAEGTWHASHFRWRIRTVITAAEDCGFVIIQQQFELLLPSTAPIDATLAALAPPDGAPE